jgi:hypothetical protein
VDINVTKGKRVLRNVVAAGTDADDFLGIDWKQYYEVFLFVCYE